jgi:hypothetical protein
VEVDRSAGLRSTDEHWAPDQIILARRALGYAGLLVVARDDDGEVVTHSPLEGMAAVEHRYPPWAMGPFGEIDPERDLPANPGVFALVQAGAVRYVGSSRNLARTFSPREIGEITRREAQHRGCEERCRLNRLVVAEAVAGRLVELYVLPLRRQLPWRRQQDVPRDVAAQILSAHRGAWHPPT